MALELKKKPGTKPGKKADAEAPKLSKKAKAEMDKPFVATLPGVNLLSPEVQEVVEQQRLKRLFLVLGGVAVAGVAAVWLLQAGIIAVAQGKLDDEQAKATDLGAQRDALAPIATYYGQVDAYKFTIQSTMAKEVLASEVLDRLNGVTPTGVDLDSVSVTLDSAAAPTGAAVPVDPTATTSTCPSQDPYSQGVVSAGCVTVDGSATSRAELSEWLDNIEADETFTVAFIPSTTADSEGGGVAFSASIGLNGETVYRNRYADPEFFKAGTN